jgi:hypothetical protein
MAIFSDYFFFAIRPIPLSLFQAPSEIGISFRNSKKLAASDDAGVVRWNSAQAPIAKSRQRQNRLAVVLLNLFKTVVELVRETRTREEIKI